MPTPCSQLILSPKKIKANINVKRGPNARKGLVIEIAICLNAFVVYKAAIVPVREAR
jgi:hypothetical protein